MKAIAYRGPRSLVADDASEWMIEMPGTPLAGAAFGYADRKPYADRQAERRRAPSADADLLGQPHKLGFTRAALRSGATA
jgi:hypothetical protein